MFCFNSRRKKRTKIAQWTIVQQHTIDVVWHGRRRRGRIQRAEKYMCIFCEQMWRKSLKQKQSHTAVNECYCRRRHHRHRSSSGLLLPLLRPLLLMCTRMRMTMAAVVTAITLVCVALATEYPFVRDNETTSRTCSALLSVIYVLMCEVWALGMCRFDSGFANFFFQRVICHRQSQHLPTSDSLCPLAKSIQ